MTDVKPKRDILYVSSGLSPLRRRGYEVVGIEAYNRVAKVIMDTLFYNVPKLTVCCDRMRKLFERPSFTEADMMACVEGRDP